ncbi:MAG: CoB--CoM heterodisulfide reductase iron-sulfur subunit B family protein [Chloroflexi bacterium]|nr:CoB--CoM heterodisulfide reductase iron-sulfur subunit B family protein [Chloroflexota bacterium]
MNTYIFYPGCSMEGSAKAYYDSLKAIKDVLGMSLKEIDDWNCCGATEYVSMNLIPAYSLIARNLALAANQSDSSKTLLAPCSACYLNLEKADYYMSERPSLGLKVNEALAAGGLHYDPGSIQIRHLLDVIINDIGLDFIKSKVTNPLTGLRIAPYLGCMVPRPDYQHRWSDYEQPTELDDVLKVLGADVIDFPLKTNCCGGHMTQIGPETAYELIRRLISSAEENNAHIMVTVCPMCQMNLDAYQSETNRYFGTNYHMPIVFFTQLMALAFGKSPQEAGFGMELTNARDALAKIGIETPIPTVKASPKQNGLPMPIRKHKKYASGQEASE